MIFVSLELKPMTCFIFWWTTKKLKDYVEPERDLEVHHAARFLDSQNANSIVDKVTWIWDPLNFGIDRIWVQQFFGRSYASINGLCEKVTSFFGITLYIVWSSLMIKF